MRRQSQVHRSIQVGGDAAPQGLLHRLPGAPCRDGPAQSALDDRDEGLDLPPLALRVAGNSPWPLATRGGPRQATRGPPRARGNHAREAPGLVPPAVVGLGIVAASGQHTRQGQPGQGVCHQGATLDMGPARPASGPRPPPHERVGPDGSRPLQPRAGAVALTGPPWVVGAGRGPRTARGIHGDRPGVRGGDARAPSDARGQDPRQQARFALGPAAPPPRGMVRHRVSSQGRPQRLGAGQQGCSPPRVQAQLCLQAETSPSRGWRIPLRGTGTGVVGYLGARALHRHTGDAEPIIACHGASPPHP